MTRKTALYTYVIIIGGILVVNMGISLIVSRWFPASDINELLDNIALSLENVFMIRWDFYIVKAFLAICVIETLVFLIYYSGRPSTRNGEEEGSSKFFDINSVNKKISNTENLSDNRILTENLSLGLSQKLLSLNTLVIGGMGSGKSYFTLIPNILQCTTSMIITDPSKELFKATGNLLLDKGVKVKILDCDDMKSSMHYNFFKYINDENDILRCVDYIFKSTVSANRTNSSQDPMWENMAKDMLLAYIGVLFYRGTEDEKNIEGVLWLMNHDFLKSDEQGNRVKNSVMALFEDLENRQPGNFATEAYASSTDGAIDTIRGVKSTLRGRLGKFILPDVKKLLAYDEMELETIGLEKTALFLAVPSEDSSFNFIVSLLYSQVIPLIFQVARKQPDNKLPVPVQFFIDEMANFVMPHDFITYLTTGRKHQISFMMFLQEIAQAESLFPKNNIFKTFIGTCNTIVYLGGSGYNTNKWISDQLGKETISVYSYNKTYGSRGSYTKQESKKGRVLLEPDEIDTKLGDDKALVYVKGEGWSVDNKKNPKKHPLFEKTSYVTGKDFDISGKDLAKFNFELVKDVNKNDKVIEIDLDNLDLYKLEDYLGINNY